MDKLRKGFRNLFSSRKRVFSAFFIVAVMFSIPLTVTLVQRQQDVRQEASSFTCAESCMVASTGGLVDRVCEAKCETRGKSTCQSACQKAGGAGIDATCVAQCEDLAKKSGVQIPCLGADNSACKCYVSKGGPIGSVIPGSCATVPSSAANSSAGGGAAQAPKCSVSIDKTNVAPYTTATITISHQNVTSCTNNSTGNGVSLARNPVTFASSAIPPGESRTYSYSCKGTNGSTIQCGSVTVRSSSSVTPTSTKAPTPTPTVASPAQQPTSNPVSQCVDQYASAYCTASGGSSSCNFGPIAGTSQCVSVASNYFGCLGYSGTQLASLANSICQTNTTPTPTLASLGGTQLSLTVTLPGIGQGTGANTNPVNPSRAIEVGIFNAQNQEVRAGSGNIAYNSSSRTYSGTISLGTGFSSGSYLVKVKVNNSLWRQIPGIFSITANSTTTLTPVTVITGDVNGDGKLSILDYNILRDCIGNRSACTTAHRTRADLNDDNEVSSSDLNIFYSGLTNRQGD